jgi:RNA polymerase sigma-70 factor (ECF subfamily)
MSSKPTDNDAAAARAEWERLMAAVVANQDRAAFAALFEYFAPRIKTFMQRSGSTEARAEELAQETMLTVWRKASLFNPASASASTWIFTVARNLRIDAFRRDRRGGVVETTDVAIEFHVDESPQADAVLVTAQTGSRVQLAIAELSEDQKKVVELSFFEEKAHAEIAAILQIPLGTVKSRIRMATIKLRNLLDEPS